MPGHYLGFKNSVVFRKTQIYFCFLLQIDQEKQRCFVVFEDRSKSWVLWKDIQTGKFLQLQHLLVCEICGSHYWIKRQSLIICRYLKGGYAIVFPLSNCTFRFCTVFTSKFVWILELVFWCPHPRLPSSALLISLLLLLAVKLSRVCHQTTQVQMSIG